MQQQQMMQGQSQIPMQRQSSVGSYPNQNQMMPGGPLP
jgi:hypothetical protein